MAQPPPAVQVKVSKAMGAGASAANSEELAIIQQGAKAWNEWRGNNKERAASKLSGAALHDRDLTGADLRGVDLSNTNLRGAKLGPGTLLWNANLSNADLYQTNLRGADLQDVNFSNADLFQADLRESNLQGADLSTAKGGLLSRQLAGSDLTGAKLPEPLSKLYDSLSSVKEISDSAQKLFLALLAGCLYSWLTIAQTTDVELITNRATTPLPIIQATIPIVGFYVVAPLILLCLYFYFHFYLQKLWEELGSLPAVFTDGRELHKRTDPWLLNDLVRSHFVKLKDGRPFLSYFQSWISVVLAWWLVPITLFLFWGRFLRRQDLFWIVFHALLLALAIVAALRLYRIGGQTLRGHERAVFRWKDVIKLRSMYSRLLFAIILGAALITISLGAVFGARSDTASSAGISCVVQNARILRTWVPCVMESVKYSPFLNLTDTDISTKPASWTGKKDEELDLVKGAKLKESHLRDAQALRAFLAKSQLQDSDLRRAYLVDADLRQSNLFHADLTEAILRRALMTEADMRNSTLDRAILTNVKLNNANLSHASMIGAKLPTSDLSGTNLQSANLHASDLRLAKLIAAHLSGADLTEALFGRAEIKYADLRKAQGLKLEQIRQALDWQLAFYDSDMLKQLGLPLDHNEKLQKQMEAELKQTKTGETKTVKQE